MGTRKYITEKLWSEVKSVPIKMQSRMRHTKGPAQTQKILKMKWLQLSAPFIQSYALSVMFVLWFGMSRSQLNLVKANAFQFFASWMKCLDLWKNNVTYSFYLFFQLALKWNESFETWITRQNLVNLHQLFVHCC